MPGTDTLAYLNFGFVQTDSKFWSFKLGNGKKNQYCRYLPLSARFYVFWPKIYWFKFSYLKKYFFRHFLYTGKISEIRTLDHMIISSLLNQCATNHTKHDMMRQEETSPLYSDCSLQKLASRLAIVAPLQD
jgi:hypothetical protein